MRTLSDLEEELRAAWGELSDAWRRFDEAADPELVESCVYRISAEKALCDYLFRAVKKGCKNGGAYGIIVPETDRPDGRSAP